jgi:multiple sugar transport system permease protein
MTTTSPAPVGAPPAPAPVTPPRRPVARRGVHAAGTYVLLMSLAVVFAGPFVWLFLAALKSKAEWVAIPPKILPESPRWDNYTAALTEINFPAYLGNSLFLSFLYATLVTFSSAAVGFGFARLRGRGKRPLFVLLLSTMMLPQILTLIPTYVLFAQVGLVNTYWPWVLWGLAASPYLVFLFRQFFAGIPTELEDAAIIDGCGYGRIFLRIFLPLSRPALLTSFLISFTWIWGDWIAPALFLGPDQTTLSVAIAAFYLDPHGNPDETLQAAAATFYVLPVLVIFLVAQRYFVRGVVSSGVKG